MNLVDDLLPHSDTPRKVAIAVTCAFNCASLFTFFGPEAGLVALATSLHSMLPGGLRWTDYPLRILFKPASADIQSIADELTDQAQMPRVPVYISRTQKNAAAFASYSAVGVGQKLVNEMNREELKGVIAHELAHIRNNDHTIHGPLNTSMVWMSLHTLLAFFAPEKTVGEFAALLGATLVSGRVRSWLSRKAEYRADAQAAHIVGDVAPPMIGLTRVHEIHNFTDERENSWMSHPSLKQRIAAYTRLHERFYYAKHGGPTPELEARQDRIHAIGVKAVQQALIAA